MRALPCGLLALLVLGCATPPATPTTPAAKPPASAEPEKQAQLPPLILASVDPPAVAWTDDVDFLALRQAYGARADFAERCEVREVSAAASGALVHKQFEEVVTLTASPLERCPVWAQLHLWRMAALSELGREEEASLHERWFLGITQSILDSGDGKTMQTPFVTISISEEYAVLTRLGLTRESQALTQSPMLDMITATDEDGNTVTLYFDPRWHFIRLVHSLSD